MGRLTSDEARDLFDYDPLSGVVKWRVNRGRHNGAAQIGQIAGAVTGNGRRLIGLRPKVYDYHIAWLLTYGEWPTHEIDHIDGDPLNCRISNLREATRIQNSFNRTKQANNKSGYKGVSWDKKNKQWVAQIAICGRQTNLGRFNRIENAALAYNFAAHKHFGQFAFFNKAGG